MFRPCRSAGVVGLAYAISEAGTTFLVHGQMQAMTRFAARLPSGRVETPVLQRQLSLCCDAGEVVEHVQLFRTT